MAKQGFWSRIGFWFGRGGRRAATEQSSPPSPAEPASSSTAIATLEGTATGLEVPPESDDLVVPRSSRRGPSVKQVLERLEDGYTKVTTLVESIQTHMEVQDRCSSEMLRSLGTLNDRLEHLPRAAEAQTDALVKIIDQLEGQSTRSQRLEEHLSQWPRLADAQRETMAAVGHQLDLSRQTDEKMQTSLTGVQDSLGALGNVTAASANALRRLEEQTAVREQQLAEALQQRTSRLTVFVGAVTAVAVLAIIAAVAALVG